MAALGIRRCHGCRGEYWNKIASPPKISYSGCKLFEHGEQRGAKIGNNAMEMFISIWRYHACSYISQLAIENVMMAADTFALLSQDHLSFLRQQNLLETILQKVKK